MVVHIFLFFNFCMVREVEDPYVYAQVFLNVYFSSYRFGKSLVDDML